LLLGHRTAFLCIRNKILHTCIVYTKRIHLSSPYLH
jgi:hypothetical protein